MKTPIQIALLLLALLLIAHLAIDALSVPPAIKLGLGISLGGLAVWSYERWAERCRARESQRILAALHKAYGHAKYTQRNLHS